MEKSKKMIAIKIIGIIFTLGILAICGLNIYVFCISSYIWEYIIFSIFFIITLFLGAQIFVTMILDMDFYELIGKIIHRIYCFINRKEIHRKLMYDKFNEQI